MDDRQKIMGMMLLAEQHQKAVEDILAGQNKTQAALDAAIKSIHEAASNAAKSAEKGARSGASDAAGIGIASATENASEALRKAVNASTTQMIDAANAAQSGAIALAKAEKSLGIRWVVIVGMAMLFCVAAFIGVTNIFAAWDESRIQALQVERSRLSNEVNGLKLALEELKRMGAKAKWQQCDGRLCVQIDTSAPKYSNDYFILKGY